MMALMQSLGTVEEASGFVTQYDYQAQWAKKDYEACEMHPAEVRD